MKRIVNKKQYPEGISKILELIRTNDIDNITLAINLAKSINFDIVDEVSPLLNLCKKHDSKVKTLQKSEEPVLNLLQQRKISISLEANSPYLSSLIFCQNTTELIIDLQGQVCPFDFEYVTLKNLHLKNCGAWPLSSTALANLAKQNLQKLIITSVPKFESNQDFYVPKELGKLANLFKLEIEHAKLKSIPSEVLALNKLELLTFHTKEAKLVLPNKIFSSSLLRYVYIDTIPSNTIQHIAPKLQFKLRKPTFSMFWQLSVWKKNSEKNWDADFYHPLLILMTGSVMFARVFYYHNFFKSDAKTISSYYIRATFLALTSLIASPFVAIIFILVAFWNSPEFYQKNTHKSSTGRVIRVLANWAAPSPSHIEGLGPMGCVGGIVFLLIFVFSDYIFPFFARMFFLPLAIIIALIGLILEPIFKLFKRIATK